MQRILFFIAYLLLISNQLVTAQRTETDFNFDWKFQLQNETAKPKQVPLNDQDWRDVRLPHDWSVEMSFSQELEGCTGYLPGGVGIYQKHFKTPASAKHKSTYVLFDGVYNNATFWLNGKLLGENPYGYSPTYWELTHALKTDGTDNVITVHVDHSRYADSRWYTGSGIYRNVKLITVDKIHVPIWGTFITTPELNKDLALVNLKVKVLNQSATATITISTKIVDSNSQTVAVQNSNVKVGTKKTTEFEQTFSLLNPKLWDCENPNMYKAITTITNSGKVIDEYSTPFGIRKIEFKVGEGFYLNDKKTLMKGVCLHHDAGLVGAAVPVGVWRRRLLELKQGGVNAIRTSHNPASEEFLDLCDTMGFLVQEEIFDEFDYPKDKRENYHDRHDDYISRGYTEHFQQWGHSDLTRTILRHRNHPSIVQWSIGNEIEWSYLHYRFVTGFWKDPNNPQITDGYWGNIPMFSPEQLKKRYDESAKGKYILAQTATRLNQWVKALDTTRPTTTNLVIPQVSHVSGYADAVDIAGYSYRGIEIPWAHKHFPHKQVTINENPGSWDDWKDVIENPGVFSMFMWTGIDYLGEAHKAWPQKGWDGDMLDFAGFKKQGWNYFKSIWVNKPHISLGTLPIKNSFYHADSISGKPVSKMKMPQAWRNSEANMHWNYAPNEMILVEVCANVPVVELFLNGRSLGSRSLSDCPDKILRWAVPFAAGTLVAKGGFEGAETEAMLLTTSEAVAVRLTTDKATLAADGYDVAHIIAQLVDKNGNEVKTTDAKLTFLVDADVKLLGVDNGSIKSTQDYQSNSVETNHGRCLAIIQSTKNVGKVKIAVTADGFATQSIHLQVK